jgi:hypothetical protein
LKITFPELSYSKKPALMPLKTEKKFVDLLISKGIVPGIKVDAGL